MCMACDRAREDSYGLFDLAECPQQLLSNMRYEDQEAWIETQDEVEVGGAKFNERLARKNSGDPRWDEIPF